MNGEALLIFSLAYHSLIVEDSEPGMSPGPYQHSEFLKEDYEIKPYRFLNDSKYDESLLSYPYKPDSHYWLVTCNMTFAEFGDASWSFLDGSHATQDSSSWFIWCDDIEHELFYLFEFSKVNKD